MIISTEKNTRRYDFHLKVKSNEEILLVYKKIKDIDIFLKITLKEII